jgi:hypothetical protein
LILSGHLLYDKDNDTGRNTMRVPTFCLAVLLTLIPSTQTFAADDVPPLTLTIYNDDFAMIQEVRGLRLARGTQEYRVSDVPGQIEPTSVRFRSLSSPESITLHEQRFEFDLVGTHRLLERYLGQLVIITIEEGGTFSGTLLNAHGDDVILQLEDGSVLAIDRGEIATLRFPSLPEGLITKPTLVWLIASTKSMKHDLAISYLTKGIRWQAEYIASIREEEGLLELSGWASIDNRSGQTFKDARVRLVAGDVHRVSPQPYRAEDGMRRGAAMMEAAAPAPGFEETPHFEYHLYTLDRPATLTDRQSKQLTLFPPTSVKAAKEFTYDGARNQKKVRVNLLLNNTKENGLGKPLPAGRIRVYKDTAGDTAAFAGEDRIGHVAEGEEVRVYLGNAFDLVGERSVLETRQVSKRSRQETVKIELRNRKDTPVTVTVIEHLRGDWKFIGTTPKVRKKEAHKVEFEVDVPRKSEKSFTYQVLYKW